MTDEKELSPARTEGLGIAVIGMACRFPGAGGVSEFWRNITGGVESISFFSDRELEEAGVSPKLAAREDYVRAAGVLDGADLFDNDFFGITPREAELLDPQQRLFLECSRQAIEDAGYDPERYAGLIGVYAGSGFNHYLMRNLAPNSGRLAGVDPFTAVTLADKDFLSSRTAYKLNLRGPAVTVQTACSTSLTAVCQACRSLAAGECDMALAGGVSVRVPQKCGYVFQEGSILSPDGRCRAFDVKASGAVASSGVGVVVLKPLEDAMEDGDQIYAVIRGAATNNDGAQRVGFTAPGADGQERVVSEARAVAGVNAEEIGFIEAHGTGTTLGDSVEAAALTASFRRETEARGFCALGSVKTNIGHADAAAGVAGLIKAILALKHGIIPPTLHFERPNPGIDLPNSPFYINTVPMEWKPTNGPRIAGVSSFGIGGSNAHVIIEEAPPAPPSGPSRPCQLLLLSARTQTTLDAQCENLARFLEENASISLADAAFTLMKGRGEFPFRKAVAATDVASAIRGLRAPSESDGVGVASGRPEIAYCFADLPRVDISGLLEKEPRFREILEASWERAGKIEECDEIMLGAAMAKLLSEWGIEPTVVLGSGKGLLAAACAAGVMEVDDACDIMTRGAGVRPVLHLPRIPIFTGANGESISDDQARNPGFWLEALSTATDAIQTPPFSNPVVIEFGAKGRLAIQPPLDAKGPVVVHPFYDRDPGIPEASSIQTALARLWLAGASINWSAYHRGEQRRRVSLPTYPFERKRFWIDAPRKSEGAPACGTIPDGPRRADLADWFYRPVWRQAMPASLLQDDWRGEGRSWLVFADESETSGELLGCLAENGQEVVTVHRSEEFSIGKKGCTLRSGHAGDFDRLVRDMETRWPNVDVIVYLWSGAGENAPEVLKRDAAWVEASGESGFFDLLRLAQSLGKAGVARPMTLAVACRGLAKVTGAERLRPENALLLGPMRVIPWEFPNIRCRVIDIDQPPGSGAGEAIVRELRLGPADPLIAYRNGERWAPEQEPVSLKEAVKARSPLRKRGAYLITGAFGGMGWTLAEHLAKTFAARLILVGRTPKGGSGAMAAIAGKAAELEKMGAEVLIETADAADPDAMRRVVERAIGKFGRIDGVIHAAGVPGGGVIQVKKPGEALRVLAPKVRGALVLHDLFREADLDFMAFCSSLTALSGSFGQVDYTAANAFLDVFAAYAAQNGGPPTVSINWDAWKEVGMAVRSDVPEALRGIREEALENGITREEGVEAFERAIACRLPQVAITTRRFASAPVTAMGPPSPAHPERPASHPPSAATHAARDPLQFLQNLWKELLGVAEAGAEDDFFDLGGQSLLAIQAISRIKDAFGVKLSLNDFFDNSSPRALAEEIARERDGRAGDRIVPLPKGGDRPVSPDQERLWFLDRFEPGGSRYNMAAALRVRGDLDMEMLNRALAETIARQESLRTRFEERNGQPVQVVDDPPQAFEIPVRDLSGAAADAVMEDVREEIRAMTGAPFRLDAGPLFRALLIRISDEDHVLTLAMHHIISDGWSITVLLREIGAIYNALFRGEAVPPQGPKVRFADYAAWLRQRLETEESRAKLAYWRDLLRDAPGPLELPFDYPRPELMDSRGTGGQVPFRIDPETSGMLADRCKRLGATPFMAMLAAVYVLLSKYSGSGDICIGTSVANRNRPEIEGLIGLFVNTLALRLKSSGDSSFDDLLATVRTEALTAFEHAEIPFEKVVEAVNPERHMNRTPLFQVMVIQQNTPRIELKLGECGVEPFDLGPEEAKFDLTFYFVEATGGFDGAIEYNTGLFRRESVEGMARALRTLFGRVARDGAVKLRDLALMDDAEQRRLLVEWNGAERDFPLERPVHELFEEQAARAPSAPAVSYRGAIMTYRELNHAANRLARQLAKRGLGPGALAGVCLGRSPDMIVALLAVLKTGAAYVPLDPSHPAERNAMILADAEVKLLMIDSAAAAETLSAPTSAELLPMDRKEPWEDGDPRNLSIRVGGDDAAYVIYTSGSTGKPKGVRIPHSALTNFLFAMKERPGFPSGGRIAGVTTISFDMAALEIYLPLISGGSVDVVPQEATMDGALLARHLLDIRPDVVQATPASWRMLIDAGWRGDRRIKALCGGEAISFDLQEDLLERTGELWNMFGPTETTVWSTVARLEPGLKPTIGRPIANTKIYILDESLRPVAPGIVGELYIGGAGLASGYFKREGLTRERFLPSPFAQSAGERIYRTGDLARYKADGSIEFLGRIDHQVKVRGFRIELGEIESVIRRCEGVREAVVVAREMGANDKRLIAYLTPDGASPPGAAALRDHTRLFLPDYMVPAAFVMLDAFPLTPNNKVDRNALPDPSGFISTETEYEAPRTETERKLADIWRELLQAGRVGVRDNFFHLGGHSLLATRMVARIRERFGMEPTLVEIFRAPTVKALAEVIDARRPALEMLSDEAIDGMSEAELDALLAGAGMDGDETT